mgnify:CR=1 FL=1
MSSPPALAASLQELTPVFPDPSLAHQRPLVEPRDGPHPRRERADPARATPQRDLLTPGAPCLQINTDLLPIEANSNFSFALASSLLPDGEKEGEGGWRAGIEGGLADDWEYVMYGKVSVSSSVIAGIAWMGAAGLGGTGHRSALGKLEGTPLTGPNLRSQVYKFDEDTAERV